MDSSYSQAAGTQNPQQEPSVDENGNVYDADYNVEDNGNK